jgi:hypothetical protein
VRPHFSQTTKLSAHLPQSHHRYTKTTACFRPRELSRPHWMTSALRTDSATSNASDDGEDPNGPLTTAGRKTICACFNWHVQSGRTQYTSEVYFQVGAELLSAIHIPSGRQVTALFRRSTLLHAERATRKDSGRGLSIRRVFSKNYSHCLT